MDIRHEIRGAHLVCRPQGEMDEAAAGRLAALLATAPLAAPKKVVLDLESVAYISSQGIAALLKLQTDLSAHKRDLSLAAPTPLVRRILYQAGLASALPIHLTVEAACGETQTP